MSKFPQSWRRAATAAILAGATLASGTALAANSVSSNVVGFDPAGEVALPSHAVEFVKINPAISMGAAYGDRSKGAHGSFGKFPGEFLTPLHIHTNAYHGVVISGTMTNPFNRDKNPPKMGPGSYWYVPAKAVHATACVSKVPCQFYFYSDAAFDFIPVK